MKMAKGYDVISKIKTYQDAVDAYRANSSSLLGEMSDADLKRIAGIVVKGTNQRIRRLEGNPDARIFSPALGDLTASRGVNNKFSARGSGDALRQEVQEALEFSIKETSTVPGFNAYTKRSTPDYDTKNPITYEMSDEELSDLWDAIHREEKEMGYESDRVVYDRIISRAKSTYNKSKGDVDRVMSGKVLSIGMKDRLGKIYEDRKAAIAENKKRAEQWKLDVIQETQPGY